MLIFAYFLVGGTPGDQIRAYIILLRPLKNSKNAHSRAKHVKNAFLYEIVILSVKRLQTSFQRKEHYFLKTCDFNFTFVLMLSHCLLNATYF